MKYISLSSYSEKANKWKAYATTFLSRLDKNKLSMHAKDGYVTALKSLFIQTPGMKQKYPDLYMYERAKKFGVSASGIEYALKKIQISHKKKV